MIRSLVDLNEKHYASQKLTCKLGELMKWACDYIQ